MDLHPLSFHEFLAADGKQQMVELLDRGEWDLIRQFRQRFITSLREYFFLGGMPEVVSAFLSNRDFKSARQVQERILAAYELDFSKHAPTNIVPRIRMIWNSIPSQLARENRKFIYGAVKPGGRAKDFELALAWLSDSGLVHKVNRISKPGLPLKAYEDFSAFKLFAVDLGLLAAMGELSERALLEGNRIYQEFKGSLTEQYVLQQLKSARVRSICYWSSQNSSGEVDFVVQQDDRIGALEVKAEENLQAKSLRAFHEKYPETRPFGHPCLISERGMDDQPSPVCHPASFEGNALIRGPTAKSGWRSRGRERRRRRR
ncbi:MAG: DUF4143 domain-containing protein [Bacteroidales bacterium]